MPHYSVMCITTRSAPTSHLVQLFSRISSTLQSASSLLTRIDHLGLRPLSHRMKAHQKYNFHGRYTRLEIIASPPVMAEVERKLRVDEEVIRFLTLKEKRGRTGASRVGYVDRDQGEEDNHPTTSLTAQPTFVDPNTLTSLQSSTSIDYFTAKVLLDNGLMSPADVLSLPRHRPDPAWDQRRLTAELESSGPSAPSAAAEEEAEVVARVDAEYEQMKLYLDKRKEQAEAARALELEWKKREDERAVERKRAIDERWLGKRVDKWIGEEKKRLSRLARRWTEEEEKTMRQVIWTKLQREKRKKELTRAPPITFTLQPSAHPQPQPQPTAESAQGEADASTANVQQAHG